MYHLVIHLEFTEKYDLGAIERSMNRKTTGVTIKDKLIIPLFNNPALFVAGFDIDFIHDTICSYFECRNGLQNTSVATVISKGLRLDPVQFAMKHWKLMKTVSQNIMELLEDGYAATWRQSIDTELLQCSVQFEVLCGDEKLKACTSNTNFVNLNKLVDLSVLSTTDHVDAITTLPSTNQIGLMFKDQSDYDNFVNTISVVNVTSDVQYVLLNREGGVINIKPTYIEGVMRIDTFLVPKERVERTQIVRLYLEGRDDSISGEWMQSYGEEVSFLAVPTSDPSGTMIYIEGTPKHALERVIASCAMSSAFSDITATSGDCILSHRALVWEYPQLKAIYDRDNRDLYAHSPGSMNSLMGNRRFF
jgi:hypothetical protein